MFKFLGNQLAKPYTHTIKSVGSSGKNIISNISEMTRISHAMTVKMREGIKSLREQPARAPRDPREDFETQYAQRGWNEDSLATQRRNVANSQAISALYMIISLAIGVWQMSLVSPESFIVPMILLTFSLISGAMFFARTFLMAMYKAQIDTRSLMTWNEFAGRPDFWSILLNPYRKAPALN